MDMNDILGYFSQNISIPEQIHELSRKKGGNSI